MPSATNSDDIDEHRRRSRGISSSVHPTHDSSDKNQLQVLRRVTLYIGFPSITLCGARKMNPIVSWTVNGAIWQVRRRTPESRNDGDTSSSSRTHSSCVFNRLILFHVSQITVIGKWKLEWMRKGNICKRMPLDKRYNAFRGDTKQTCK